MSNKMTLDERVTAFKYFELPGQPMSCHMGTSYLVNDLAKAVESLTAERDADRVAHDEALSKITRLEGEAKVLRTLLGKCVDVIDTLLDDADEGYSELLSLKEACAEAITPPRQWVPA